MFFRYREGVPIGYRGGLYRRYHKGVREPHLGGTTQLDSLAALFDELGDESSPSGLMACTDPGAVVSMEVLVEIDEVAPMGIALKFLDLAINGTPSFRRTQENAGEPS